MKLIEQYKWLWPSMAFSTVLIATRVIYRHELLFSFLIWNLFLAAVPLYMSQKAVNATSKTGKIVYALLWLLFFPNSMYIITDLFHLKDRPGIPLWYDLMLLFSAAMNGVLLGLLSIINMEKLMHGFENKRLKRLGTLAVFVLCGYGIYLGRYERWNSWDVVTKPHSLFYDILYDVIHPFRSAEAWMLSICFAVWMYIIYQYVRKLYYRKA